MLDLILAAVRLALCLRLIRLLSTWETLGKEGVSEVVDEVVEGTNVEISAVAGVVTRVIVREAVIPWPRKVPSKSPRVVLYGFHSVPNHVAPNVQPLVATDEEAEAQPT